METNKAFKKYLGYKFFKQIDENTFKIIRLVKIFNYNDKVRVIDLDTNTKEDMTIKALKGYTPLEPFGFIAFSAIKIADQEDVMVTVYRLLDIKLDINEPYAICRQSITDFFYNLIANDPNHNLVGVSVTRDNCPTNIPYTSIAACDELLKYVTVHYYLDDTIDTILQCLSTDYFDDILKKLFTNHLISSNKGFSTFLLKPSVDGWCKTLRQLLIENNLITDLDSLRGICAFDFCLNDYLIEDNECFSLNNEALLFFRNVFKVNAIQTFVIKYDYDIDLAEFNNSNYTLVRDNKDILYIIVYTIDGEYLEKDLEDSSTELDVTSKLRLAFYNKYYTKGN